MRNYYTLKEILLALRKEQLAFNDKLHQLEGCLDNYNDRFYAGSYFFPMSLNGMKFLSYCLSCDRDAHDRSYSLFIDDDINFRVEKMFLELRKRNNGDYHIATNRVKVLEEKQSQFNGIIDDILNDQFFKNVKEVLSFEDSEGNKELLIDSDSINYAQGDCVQNLRIMPRISYYASRDLVVCRFPVEKIGDSLDKTVNEILATKIPKEYLSNYLNRIIENSGEIAKDILIHDEKIYQINARYKFIDDNGNYALQKRRQFNNF